jgi:hypothetical protein
MEKITAKDKKDCFIIGVQWIKIDWNGSVNVIHFPDGL